MPIAALRLGEPSSGFAEVQLMEYIPGIDNLKIHHFLRGCPTIRGGCTPSMTKEELKHLLGVAQSDKERECIRYAVYKASGLSATQARKQFGFENMSERYDRVEEALKEVQSIRECVESLSNTQEQAILKSFASMSVVTQITAAVNVVILRVKVLPSKAFQSPFLCRVTTNYFKYWRSLNSISLNSHPELQKLTLVTRKMILTLSVLWRMLTPNYWHRAHLVIRSCSPSHMKPLLRTAC